MTKEATSAVMAKPASLVCYEISSGSDDECEIPGLAVKEEPKDSENEHEKMDSSEDESMEEVEEQNPLELIPPATNGDADMDVVVLSNYRQQEPINISSDSQADTDSSCDSSDSEEDSNSELSLPEVTSTVANEDAEDAEKDEKDENDKDEALPSTPGSKKPAKKKLPMLDCDIDLPPIQDLHISVEESEAKLIGIVTQIVENQVVVQSYPDIPVIDLDSILFLDLGKRALGKVFDVFGPVQLPLYVVRFNSTEHIQEREVKIGVLVYFAPQTEHTSYIILQDLMSQRGSDASWRDNRECPDKYLDYSDDEDERKAKQARKQRGTKEPANNTHEFESSVKRVRNDARRNPFSDNFNQGNDGGNSSWTARRRSDSCDRKDWNSEQNRGQGDYKPHWRHSRGVQFGGPPQFLPPMSPFPPYSPSPMNRNGRDSADFYCNTPPPPLATPPPFANGSRSHHASPISSPIPSPLPHHFPQHNIRFQSLPPPHMPNQAPPSFVNIQTPPRSQLNTQVPPPPPINTNLPPPHHINNQALHSQINTQVHPPVQVNTQAPPSFQNQALPVSQINTQVPPPHQIITQAPPHHQIITQVPPPPHQIITQAPPPHQIITQAPPHLQLNTRAPPPLQINTQAPPSFQINTQAPPPVHIYTQAPPTSHINTQAPPPSHINTYAPPLNIQAAAAPPRFTSMPPPSPVAHINNTASSCIPQHHTSTTLTSHPNPPNLPMTTSGGTFMNQSLPNLSFPPPGNHLTQANNGQPHHPPSGPLHPPRY